jgi:hypothetical protein
MKLVPSMTKNTGFPHLIIRADNRNAKWFVGLANEPSAFDPHTLFCVVGEGYADAWGNITGIGRAKLVDLVKERITRTAEHICIVWSKADSTYLDACGSEISGTRPPVGEAMVVDDGTANAKMLIQSVAYVTLPSGTGPSHLCVEQCGPFVHICQGAPLLLADFRDAPCAEDQPRHLMNRDGTWPSPLLYRGVRVERVDPGPVFWGPVQPIPNAPSITLRDPWPEQLAEACQDLAERALQADVLDAAWRAIHPEHPDLVRADVREAA